MKRKHRMNSSDTIRLVDLWAATPDGEAKVSVYCGDRLIAEHVIPACPKETP